MSFSISSFNHGRSEQSRKTRLGVYLIILGLIVASSLCLSNSLRGYIGTLFLVRVGEIAPVETIVGQQLAESALYGSAIYEDHFIYKLELVRHQRPVVIALGSSRALQFREEFFSVPFTNAGRGMNEIDEGLRFVEELLHIHLPAVVILTIDFWWFNPNRSYREPSPRDLSDTSGAVSTFWSYVNDRKLSLGEIVRPLLGDKSNPISTAPAIGIEAHSRGRGFRSDGSRDYGARYFGLDPSFDDVRFENSIHRARQGLTLLSHGAVIDQSRVNLLESVIRRFQQEGIRVVAILPPIANAVMGVISGMNEEFSYIDRVRDALSGLPVPLFDFTDPLTLSITDDCEFADGLHGGDVMYQRMLLHMVEQGGIDRDLLRLDNLAANIEKYKGHAVSLVGNYRYRSKEVDFLQIGCRK